MTAPRMSFCVVFTYTPTNSVGRVWTTFETREEAQRWATERVSPGYSFEIRALCQRADWPSAKAVDDAVVAAAGGVSQ